MAMVCPQCSQTFDQEERQCPECSVQLLFFARFAAPPSTANPSDDAAGDWQQTPWGKIIVGLILAQGLALGVQQLLTAGLLARGHELGPSLWSTLAGIAILHGLHALGLLVGGALSGAGQARGVLYGSLVGLLNGFIFLFLERRASAPLPEFAVYAQPFLHLALGALGGFIGQVIWRPTPKVALPESKQLGDGPPSLEMRWLQGPIHWWRIVAGATLVGCGVIWSNLIVQSVLDASQGALSLSTHFQARVVRWEISGLAILLGATFAGATTYNGMKQGLCVGLGASVLFIGFHLANPKVNLETVVFTIVSMVGLGVVGGWFGGQLFPPLGIPRRRRRVADA
jgi:hypothetical protein